MFFHYRKMISICSLSIWTILLFLAGVSFGSPQLIINKQDIPIDDTKIKKINEEVVVNSQAEGSITYTVQNVTYTAQKQVFFQIEVSKMTAFNYIVCVKDVQNQDLELKEYHRDKIRNSANFQVDLPDGVLNTDIYIVVYPVAEETYTTRKTTDKAYGKTIVNIPAIRQAAINQLK